MLEQVTCCFEGLLEGFFHLWIQRTNFLSNIGECNLTYKQALWILKTSQSTLVEQEVHYILCCTCLDVVICNKECFIYLIYYNFRKIVLESFMYNKRLICLLTRISHKRRSFCRHLLLRGDFGSLEG